MYQEIRPRKAFKHDKDLVNAAKQFMEERDLEIKFKHIPCIMSDDEYIGRKRQEILNDLGVKYQVKLFKNGKEILETDLTSGVGNYFDIPYNAKITLHEFEILKSASHHGRNVLTKDRIPDLELTMLRFFLDAYHTLDFDSFEDFATCLGYDTDSRKAEKIYNEELTQAIKLKNHIGSDDMEILAELMQDF